MKNVRKIAIWTNWLSLAIFMILPGILIKNNILVREGVDDINFQNTYLAFLVFEFIAFVILCLLSNFILKIFKVKPLNIKWTFDKEFKEYVVHKSEIGENRYLIKRREWKRIDFSNVEEILFIILWPIARIIKFYEMHTEQCPVIIIINKDGTVTPIKETYLTEIFDQDHKNAYKDFVDSLVFDNDFEIFDVNSFENIYKNVVENRNKIKDSYNDFMKNYSKNSYDNTLEIIKKAR